jgi:hypothetical protein
VLSKIYNYFFSNPTLNHYDPNAYNGYDENSRDLLYYEEREHPYNSLSEFPQVEEPLLGNNDEFMKYAQKLERERSYIGYMDEHIELADNRVLPVSYDADLIKDHNPLRDLDKI